ncbi:MAG: type II toxin-antitoxin system RelE/ParE family toxin [Thermodesulfobacteriota bacterium]|nr:type II toxin-antitoxin system RelE/ParE family toxin [Thermodesulfobacteriota bacterium]
MKYNVKLTPIAANFLTKQHPENKKLIKASLKELALNPYSGKELQEELSGFWTYKPKRFRVIYKIDDTDRFIRVYIIGHRKEIYELFSDALRHR